MNHVHVLVEMAVLIGCNFAAAATLNALISGRLCVRKVMDRATRYGRQAECQSQLIEDSKRLGSALRHEHDRRWQETLSRPDAALAAYEKAREEVRAKIWETEDELEASGVTFRCAGCYGVFFHSRTPGCVKVGAFEFCSETCHQEPLTFPTLEHPMN
jgi:hypothetical protein